jgi:archaellum biogenesis ATPase FlaH
VLRGAGTALRSPPGDDRQGQQPVTEFDAVSYLASKGLHGRAAAGGREMTYPCFFDCDEPRDSKKRKLYLEVSTGFYHCKVCLASGGSYLLQQHFGDSPDNTSTNEPFLRRQLLDAATQVGQTMLANNDEVLLYLAGERGLTYETVTERRLGFVAGGWSLTGDLPEHTSDQLKSTGLVYRDGPKAGKDFFYRHILIPYLARGHTIQLRGRIWGETTGGKYMTGPGEPVRLYNADSLDGADEVIVAEGEFDAMILSQALAASPEDRARRIAVIALPGTNSVPEEFDAVLSEAKRIYLGLDSDEPGLRAAETLKERIGPRARVLTLPSYEGRKCDWTEFLLPGPDTDSTDPRLEVVDLKGDWVSRHPYSGHDWRDVLRLLSSASGKRIFSIAEAGEAFRSARAANDGFRTGFRELDGILKPGLLPGQVLVALAKTGAGKTVWLCNLAYNMRKHKILFVSLEMTREEVYERMRRIYLFHHRHATDYEVERGLANVYICDENRLGERDLANLISEFTVEADGPPEIVFVDYLGYFARAAAGSSQYEKVTNAVMGLKGIAKAGRFAIITPHQVNRGAKEGKPIELDDARDSGAVEETADFLLALFRPDDALNENESTQTSTGKVRCSILKSRHGGKGRVLSFQMDMLTLAMVDDNTRESRWAVEHNEMHRRGHDWISLRRHETQPQQTALGGMP